MQTLFGDQSEAGSHNDEALETLLRSTYDETVVNQSRSHDDSLSFSSPMRLGTSLLHRDSRRRDIDRDEISRIRDWRDTSLSQAQQPFNPIQAQQPSNPIQAQRPSGLMQNIQSFSGMIDDLDVRHENQVRRHQARYHELNVEMQRREQVWGRDLEMQRIALQAELDQKRQLMAQMNECMNTMERVSAENKMLREQQMLRDALNPVKEEKHAHSFSINSEFPLTPTFEPEVTRHTPRRPDLNSVPQILSKALRSGLDFIPNRSDFEQQLLQRDSVPQDLGLPSHLLSAPDLFPSNRGITESTKLRQVKSENRPTLVPSSETPDTPILPSNSSQNRASSEKMRPEIFNVSKETWREYAERFERIAVWNGWSDKDAATFLMTRIAGEPLCYVKRQPMCVQMKWSLLKEALNEYYNQPSIVLKYQAEFDAIEKKTTETWTELAQRIRTLSEKAYGKRENLHDPLLEAILLAKFLKALPDHIYSVVALRDPNVLEEASVAAMKVEAVNRKAPSKPSDKPLPAADAESVLEQILKFARTKSDTVATVSSSSQGNGDNNAQTQNNYNSNTNRGRGRGRGGRGGNDRGRGGNRGRGRSGKSSRSFKYPDTECYKCSGTGHIATNCPSEMVYHPEEKPAPEAEKNFSSDQAPANDKSTN